MRYPCQLLGTLTVPVVGIIFSTSFSNNFLTPKIFVFSLFIAILLILLSLQWNRNKKISFLKNPPFLSVIFFLIFLLLSSFYNPLPLFSQPKSFEYFLWILFIGTIALTSRHEEPAGLLTILEAFGIPLILYGFLQHFGWDPIAWHPGGKRIFSFIGNADHFAAVLGILLALSGIQFMLKPNAWRLILILGELLALEWSYTRFPFLALIVVALVGLVLFRNNKTLALFLFFFLSSIFSIYFFGQNTEAGHSPLRYWKRDHNILGRKYLFAKGIELATFHPWTGIGVGNFSNSYLLLRSDEPAFYRSRLAIGESTHNTFLDLFVETGLFGGISFLLIWILALYRIFKKAQSIHPSEKMTGITLFIPLVMAFLLLQFVFPEPAMMALSGYLLGLSIGFSPPEKERMSLSLEHPSLVVVLSFLLSFLIVTYAAHLTIADWFKKKAEDTLNQNRPEAAISFLMKSVRWDPWDPVLYQDLGKAFEFSEIPDKALLNYNLSAKFNERNPYLWGDIGRLAAKNNWKRRALTAYAKAIQLDPYNPFLHHDAALTSLHFREYGLALFLAQEAYRLEPENKNNQELLLQTRQAINQKNETIQSKKSPLIHPAK